MGVSMPGNTPFLAVVKWCELAGLGRDDLIFYDQAISAMDDAYRAWFVAKNTPKEGQM